MNVTATDKQETPAARPRRSMKTAKSVLIADKIADATIRIGGIGVIVAVFGIMLFLAQVVVPLFTGARVTGETTTAITHGANRTLMDLVDEYKTLSVSVDAAGVVSAFHIKTGRGLTVPSFDLGGQVVTAFTRTLNGGDIAFGFGDGTLRLARLKVGGVVLNQSEVPPNLERINEIDLTDGSSIYTPTSGGQVRKLVVGVELEEPQQIAPAGAGIVAIDYRIGGTIERPTKSFVTVDSTGVARLSRAESRTNMLTRQTTTRLTTSELPGLPVGVEVADVLMTGKADQVFIAVADGTVYRYDTRDFDAPVLAETMDLLPGAAEIGVIGFLIGEQSLVVGGSDGSVNVYFRLQLPDAKTADGYEMVLAHALEPHDAGVVAMDASQRGKMFVTADTEGRVWLRHSTSEQVLLRLAPEGPARYQALALAPRENGIVAITDTGAVHAWDVAAPHPETTLKTIFGKVWYEGYQEPGYTWQSSSGSDEFEPKLSLVPLIFGTIKGTVYSLLFAIPIALGAAIFTSEFVNPSVRAVVKPTMEMMASLPSVVLGFIAALILAPLVETWIAAVFLAFVAVPTGLFVGAYLWQLLPNPVALKYGGAPKFILMFLSVLLFGFVSYAFGPTFERIFFAGDFAGWANGTVGSSVPFTTLLVFPFVFLALYLATTQLILDRFGNMLRHPNRTIAGLADMARWLVTMIIAAAASISLAGILVGLGIDPRDSLIGTYVQRNTLIVGFAMGFAVIPIIYTIAEDALNSVPEHLRAASLACGATPWQTAVRVILPTAMSGVFSAIMVGMGRAVGETMIVVMAAGNTPILEWNVFNGLRALSANIAVELPEAVRDSTLYRMLFLAALVLFVMTFAVNTLAEVIRQRFRKRAAAM